MAKEGLTAQDYLACYTPEAAVSWIVNQRLTVAEARAAILDRLAKGALDAIAHREIGEAIFGDEYSLEFSRVPRTAWLTRSIPDQFWTTGDIDFPSRGSKARPILWSNGPVSYFGVRFERLGIDLLVERAHEWRGKANQLALPGPQTNQKRRGPRPKAFWEPMMQAIEANISSGELVASCQADIERAMAAWLDEHDEDAGESTVRNYARRVWERIGTEGQ